MTTFSSASGVSSAGKWPRCSSTADCTSSATGRIVAATPSRRPCVRADSPGPAGMIILATSDLAEARILMDAEPLTARGLRTYDLRPWEIREGTLREAFSHSADDQGASPGACAGAPGR